MKFPYNVLYGGKFYATGEDVPMPEEEPKVEAPSTPVEETPVKAEKKAKTVKKKKAEN